MCNVHICVGYMHAFIEIKHIQKYVAKKQTHKNAGRKR